MVKFGTRQSSLIKLSFIERPFLQFPQKHKMYVTEPLTKLSSDIFRFLEISYFHCLLNFRNSMTDNAKIHCGVIINQKKSFLF